MNNKKKPAIRKIVNVMLFLILVFSCIVIASFSVVSMNELLKSYTNFYSHAEKVEAVTELTSQAPDFSLLEKNINVQTNQTSKGKLHILNEAADSFESFIVKPAVYGEFALDSEMNYTYTARDFYVGSDSVDLLFINKLGYNTQTLEINVSSEETLEGLIKSTIDKVFSTVDGEVLWEDESVTELNYEKSIMLPKYQNESDVFSLRPAQYCDEPNKIKVAEQLTMALAVYRSLGLDYDQADNIMKQLELGTDDIIYYQDIIKEASRNKALNFNLLLKELLVYHKKITSVTDWEKKLDSITYSIQFDSGKTFHGLGFPPPSSNCLLYDYYAYWGRAIIKVDLEMWLYSFWLRRYKSETMDITHASIKILLELLDE